MNAFERLNRVRNARYKYQRLIEKTEELEAIATRTVPILSQTPEVHTSINYKDDTWAKLADYKAECRAALNQYLTDCRELEKELECIKSLRIRTAMQYRYIDGMQVADIGTHMGYDERSIRRFLRTGEKIYCESMYEKGEGV